MKPRWRRFAPLGLYLSLLAALTSAGLYIVQREWNLPLQLSLALIIVGLALYALLDPEKVRTALTGRQARYGSNALVLTIAFVGILVVVNYLAYQNAQRWDLTEDQQFTLAAETRSTLESLEQPVQAQAFFTPRLPSDQARNLLDQYKFHSDGKFDYEFIDPEANPVAAQEAEIDRDGTVVLRMADRMEPVTLVDEEELTSALLRLKSPELRSVYFLTGHGEYSPDDTGEESYSQAKSTLERKNYTVKTLNLLAEKAIPDDAKTVVIAGPRQPVSQEEVDLLSQYLGAGGSVIVAAEPLPLTEFGEAADPLADYLSQSWGVVLGQDIIADPTSNQPFITFAAEYGDHAITAKMERVTSVFPTARSVQVQEAQGASQAQLVLTAQQSWAETDLAALQGEDPQLTFDEGQDTGGPVALAAAAENFDTQGRIVVFGDSDFGADAYFRAYGNGDLLVNSIDWATGQEDLINLTPKNNTQRLMLPPQRFTMNLILLGSVFVLPGLALLSGILVWLQRRRRG